MMAAGASVCKHRPRNPQNVGGRAGLGLYMVKSLYASLALGLSLLIGCSPTGPVDLAAMKDWDIVVAPDASPSEVYAAGEFQGIFQRAAGVKLPIVRKVDRGDRHVFIGPGEAMRASPVGFSVEGFSQEDLRIVARGRNIAIAGGRPRGTLYGAYTFLEDYLGVRFLTADHTHVPPIGTTSRVGPVDRFYHPLIAWRWAMYGESDRYPAFLTRLRGNAQQTDPNLGGRSDLPLINHSLAGQLPLAKYGKEHPEYYAEEDGVRRVNVRREWDSGGVQACMSNPEVVRIITEYVLATLARNPALKSVSVSQNDNVHYCRCAACTALYEREGSTMAPQLLCVNAVADAVAQKYPGVLVGTIAYQYTRKPCRTITPRPNVLVELCSFEACVIHPLDDPNCPQNVEFCRDLQGWSKVSKHVFIWNYNGNFRDFMLPFPNLRAIGPNVRLFVAAGIPAVFMHGASIAGTINSDLADMRNYLVYNLLWDPSRDAQKVMDEFLTLHYGPAGAPIRRWIDFIQDRAEASGLHPCCYGHPVKNRGFVSLNYDQAIAAGMKIAPSIAGDFGIDASIGAEGLKAFEEAFALAGDDPVLRRRLEKASISAYRAAIEPIWHRTDPAEVDPATLERLRPLAKRFFELCVKLGATHTAENYSSGASMAKVLKLYGVSKLGDL